jgi:hypothetical protein
LIRFVNLLGAGIVLAWLALVVSGNNLLIREEFIASPQMPPEYKNNPKSYDGDLNCTYYYARSFDIATVRYEFVASGSMGEASCPFFH